MPTRRTSGSAPRFFAILLVMLAATSAADAASGPSRLATTGRFDLSADGPIHHGRLLIGDGTIARRNWVAADQVDRGYTVDFRVNRLGWKPIEVGFTPERSGSVTLALMGPWAQAPGGGLYRQEVLWDALTVEGAELASDGDFETKRGWSGDGTIEAGTSETPAASGSRLGRTWHDAPLVAQLTVRAGVPVVVRLQARARTPEGFRDMKRLEGRDTPAHRNALMFRKGANLGNGLEVPPGQDWAVKYTAEDIRRMKAEGFDHVRIPVGWHHYAGPAPDYSLSPEIFRRVEVFLDAAAREGLAAMINIHHFDDFTSDPDGQKAKFLAIWRQVADRYAKRPANVAFELLNEPRDAATTEVMNPIYADAVRTIRATNPDRLIVIGPGRWNSASELPALRLPDEDANILVTVHSYDPFFFTHQGASWTNRGDDGRQAGIRFPGPPETPLVPDPSLQLTPGFLDWIRDYNTAPARSNPSSTAAMDGVVEQVREWSEFYGRPVHLGEFGAIRAADPRSRANYYGAFRERLEAAGVGWAIWDWRAGFDYWDAEKGRPFPGLHEALFGKP